MPGRFQEVVTDTTMVNYIATKIDYLEKLSPGMPAPTFSYPYTAGNKIGFTDSFGRRQ